MVGLKQFCFTPGEATCEEEDPGTLIAVGDNVAKSLVFDHAVPFSDRALLRC